MTAPLIYRIGKSPQNCWVINNDTVLEFHAEIFVDPQKNVFFSPLNPKGACYAGGKRVTEPILLERGTELVIGSQLLDWEYRLFGVQASTNLNYVKSENQHKMQKERKVNRQLIVIYVAIVVALFFLSWIV
jgi:hypothetical protein